ncbi:hypothetical protein MRB53_039071 [Persea americana]|nr:hypothetical protein MRB53_039071 [Persea americana]
MSATRSSTARLCASTAQMKHARTTGTYVSRAFAKGATTTGAKHKPWHPYRIISPVERPLFKPDWSGDEELLLLQGSEKFGLGNWADVAEHVGNKRTKKNAIGTTSRQEFQLRKKRRIEGREALQRLPPPTKSKPITSTPSCHEIQGYMPGRLEFEHEYENEAEVSVKDLEFDQDLAEGNDEEVQLKLTVLDIYNSRLTRRADRKRVIFEHGCLDYKKNQAIDKKRAKEERDIIVKTKPFTRLMNAQDYDLFVEGLLGELTIRRRIAELQEWRKMGLTMMDQGQKYEKDKQHRLMMRNNSNINPMARYNGVGSTKSIDFKRNLNLGIAQTTDVQLLSREEQSLCSNLRMLPKAYLVVKETILRELWRTGGSLTKKNARQLLKIDSNKTGKGGALEVPDGETVIPVINDMCHAYTWGAIVATQDYHPRGHISFASTHGMAAMDTIDIEFEGQQQKQVLWPDHCIQGTHGVELHTDLKREAIDRIFQ